MRALDPEVADSVWAAIEGLIPVLVDTHPLGCHRLRASAVVAVHDRPVSQTGTASK